MPDTTRECLRLLEHLRTVKAASAQRKERCLRSGSLKRSGASSATSPAMRPRCAKPATTRIGNPSQAPDQKPARLASHSANSARTGLAGTKAGPVNSRMAVRAKPATAASVKPKSSSCVCQTKGAPATRGKGRPFLRKAKATHCTIRLAAENVLATLWWCRRQQRCLRWDGGTAWSSRDSRDPRPACRADATPSQSFQ